MEIQLKNNSNKILDRIIRKLPKSIYFIISCGILIAGLTWCSMIFEEVLDKGRMPIESDGRFIKGVRLDLGIVALMGMTYGSFIWIVITGILFWYNEIKNNILSSRIGLIGLIINILTIYLMFFSETGQWILD